MDPTVLAALIAGFSGILAALISALGAQGIIAIWKPPRKDNSGREITVSKTPQPDSTETKETITTVPPATKPKSKILVAILAVIGGIIGAVLGYFFIAVPVALSSCPFFASTSVPITSPAEGSSVPIETIVQGTSCHIPSDKKLWVLVVEGGIAGYYYPQNGPIEVSSDGKWSAGTFIGSTKDVGKEFVLYTALADHEGEATLQQYISSGRASGKFPPIPLPTGVQLISQVQVVRK